MTEERLARYRVLYRDVDAMGVLYYGRYLALFELGRVEWMRDEGYRYRRMEEEEGLILPVTATHCRYHDALRYDDLAVVSTWIAAWSTTTVRFAHRVTREDDGALCATGEVELGCLTADGWRPARLPRPLVELLSQVAGDRKGRVRKEAQGAI